MSGVKTTKCVVWDLDHTLWDGVLLEDAQVALRPGVVQAIEALDRRGILQSIASKNDHDHAMARLKAFGLDEYFLYPQITWSAKAASLQAIAGALNIALDSLALIDDQAFEREEVRFSLPEVLTIDAADLGGLLDLPSMNPPFLTEDARNRRRMYLSDMERKQAEEVFVGPPEAFLATLAMVFRIGEAREEDLRRAEELTVRTHQLNTTGYTYSYDELDQLRQSDRHLLLVAGLDDKYGSYGTIGLALVERDPAVWTIKLLLMSCRVMSRSVGTIMLSQIMTMAREAGARLRAEFISNDRNRMMYVTYKFANFRQVEQRGELIVLENDLEWVQPFPAYVTVQVAELATP